MYEAGEDDVLGQAARWYDEGHGVAIATVITTWSSSPRPAGSQLVVRDDGQFAGSVSGGCAEQSVIAEARKALEQGAPRLFEFGVSDEQARAVGLACGGRATVYIEALEQRHPTKRELLEALLRARAARQPVALVTYLATGEQRLLSDGQTLGSEIDEAVTTAMNQGEPQRARHVSVEGDEMVFIHPHLPAARLWIVGGVHIAQHLLPMAQSLGYDVALIDPRGSFANPQRFERVALHVGAPDEMIEQLGVDRRTAIVTLTHLPDVDDLGLGAALSSPAFYIGALGSRRTHALRVERLRDRGFSEEEVARIRGPVGIDIGARTPAEIALSIAAEMTLALRGPRRRPGS